MATVNRDPVAVVVAELMRRGQMPSVSELMLGTLAGTGPGFWGGPNGAYPGLLAVCLGLAFS